jgi:hypothetical protein
MPADVADRADIRPILVRPQLLALMAGAGMSDIQLDGDETILATIVSLTDEPDPAFAIATP